MLGRTGSFRRNLHIGPSNARRVGSHTAAPCLGLSTAVSGSNRFRTRAVSVAVRIIALRAAASRAISDGENDDRSPSGPTSTPMTRAGAWVGPGSALRPVVTARRIATAHSPHQKIDRRLTLKMGRRGFGGVDCLETAISFMKPFHRCFARYGKKGLPFVAFGGQSALNLRNHDFLSTKHVVSHPAPGHRKWGLIDGGDCRISGALYEAYPVSFGRE
jgi:hypothetical protein